MNPINITGLVALCLHPLNLFAAEDTAIYMKSFLGIARSAEMGIEPLVELRAAIPETERDHLAAIVLSLTRK